MTKSEILGLIATKPWYHCWQIAPGIFTPGQTRVDPARMLDYLGVPRDLSGKTAIDIGAWDGPLSFELERRGAKVTAMDIQDPNQTGFNVAKEIVGSNVEYIRAPIYELGSLRRDFDVILFCGVYYHLKHPILGFEQIGKAANAETVLYFEGEILRTYVETLGGERKIPLIARGSEIPYCASYPGKYRGATNWFIPNLQCLKGWLDCAGFEMFRHRFVESFLDKSQRIFGAARRVNVGEIPEHAIVGELTGSRII